jgi:asparagine N-glycosylation enzyme membrane subunit Stt3
MAVVMTVPPSTNLFRRLACLTAVLLLAAGLRLLDAPQVFTDGGTRFTGNDAHYHILRTQRTIEEYPQAPWFDQMMNYPHGAEIPWPPLFDHSAASAAMLVGGGVPSPTVVERVAAYTPVFIGLLTLPLVALLAWLLLGERFVCAAAFLFAVLPAHTLFSSVGRFDQHVAEVFFLLWITLAFAAAWRPAISAGWALGVDVLLGTGVCLAFWTWQGSALHLLFLVTCVAIWHVMAPQESDSATRMSRSLARGGAVGTGLLLVSVIALAPRGSISTMSLLAISGFHAALTGLVTGFGGILWLLRRKSPTSNVSRRLAEVAAAGFAPMAAAITMIPGFWFAVRHGLVALGKGNDWYRNIQEFDPLLFAGFEPIWVEAADALSLFGLGLVLLPVAVILVIRDRRKFEPGVVCFLAVFAFFFLLLALTRQRFVVYLAAPLALLVGYLWMTTASTIADKINRRLQSGLVMSFIGLIIVAPSVKWYADRDPASADASANDLTATLQWLRDSEPTDSTRPAVLAEWSLGHHIQYLAEKPVVANPFGTDIGPEAMNDTAEFFLARDPSVAEGVITRRRVGFVVLTNPVVEAHFALAYAPAGTPPAVRVTPARFDEMLVRVERSFWGLVPSRLFFFDGMVPSGFAGEALGGYRLLYESQTETVWDGQMAKTYKVFGVVPGAKVSILAPPGSRVTARTRLRTNQGRESDWASVVVADGHGKTSIRLPYATGLNGAVEASAYELLSDHRRSRIHVAESDVVNGLELTASLDAHR